MAAQTKEAHSHPKHDARNGDTYEEKKSDFHISNSDTILPKPSMV
jgi:hypothetical protein